jgi:regulator of replication initiation timing
VLPFTDNLVSVVAGLLAIATFAAGALGYVAKTARDERNELEGAVASLERQADDLRQTNETLVAENDGLREQNDELITQLDERATTPVDPEQEPPTDRPPQDGDETPTSYQTVYSTQKLTLTGSCYGQNRADLDVPEVGADDDRWDVDYDTCVNGGARLAFARSTRHAPGPDGATAEECADVLRRSGVGSDQVIAPVTGAVYCIDTAISPSERDLHPPRVVRMVIGEVHDGEQVDVEVEAWQSA